MTENQVSESDALNAPNKRKYIDRYFRECRRIGGVQNVIVFNSMGIPKQSTFERDETIRAIGLFDDLITKTSRAIQTVHRLDTFASMRLRTRKFEILITKDLDDLYFVVFQNIDGKKGLNLTAF